MTVAGVIGLGAIGRGVASCLARAGLLAAVHDVRAEAGDGLDGMPPFAGSPAELARACDVAFVAVVDAKQTRDVLSGPDGLLAAARPGLHVVLLATISLEDLADIRRLTDTASVALIDCGVVGGPRAGQNGLICLVGAEEAGLARVMPVLEGFARYVVHLGGPGAGMAGKIIHNAIHHATRVAGYEGAVLAKAAGIDAGLIARVFADSRASVGGPLALALRSGDPGADLGEAEERRRLSAMIDKDLDAALALGAAVGVPLPAVGYARETLTANFIARALDSPPVA